LKQVVVRPAAAADIEDAYRWYESQRPGLGDEFLQALRVTRDRVLEQPEAFPVLHRDTRRALIPQRFPYGLFYPGKLTVADSFRVGCIGRLGEAEMRGALGAMRVTLEEMGVTDCGPVAVAGRTA